MTFEESLDQVVAMLQRRGRVAYRTLKMQFDLSDDGIEAVKDELIYAQQVARDEDNRVLVWVGDRDSTIEPTPASAQAPTEPASTPTSEPEREPVSYTPPHLAEKILTSRSALEGERKVVTVCFADIKDSTELIKDLDPEDAQQLLDPAIHIMMDAVHRFEGTVNQVLGDGIMSIFGAPISHEDHALRACYAALAMQAAMQPYADEMFRAHGITMQIRVGLNSGEVVVRTIGNDLHMDYSAVGQTSVAERSSFLFFNVLEVLIEPLTQPGLNRRGLAQHPVDEAQRLKYLKITTRIDNDMRALVTQLLKCDHLARFIGKA